LARFGLARRIDAVLEIDEDRVGAGRECFRKSIRTRAGHEEQRAQQHAHIVEAKGQPGNLGEFGEPGNGGTGEPGNRERGNGGTEELKN
jgi:hypothetical protein